MAAPPGASPGNHHAAAVRAARPGRREFRRSRPQGSNPPVPFRSGRQSQNLTRRAPNPARRRRGRPPTPGCRTRPRPQDALAFDDVVATAAPQGGLCLWWRRAPVRPEIGDSMPASTTSCSENSTGRRCCPPGSTATMTTDPRRPIPGQPRFRSVVHLVPYPSVFPLFVWASGRRPAEVPTDRGEVPLRHEPRWTRKTGQYDQLDILQSIFRLAAAATTGRQWQGALPRR